METEILTASNNIVCRNKMDAEKQATESKTRKVVLVQVFLGLVANLVSIAPGMSLGFSAIALPTLQNVNSTFHVNKDEASWIASMAPIATPMGCVLTGSMLERFGRKFTLVTVNVPSLIGWLFIALANGDYTLLMIYIGRFFTGLATGMSAVPATVYSAEMSTDKLRGMFITWTSISMSLGIMFVYILGYFLQDDWRMVAGISALFPATALILIYFCLPETASWLLSRGKHDQAEVSLKLTRGLSAKCLMPPSVSHEYEILAQKYNNTPGKEAGRIKYILKKFFKMSTIKPFIIMNLFFFFQQFSGIFVIIFYAVDVVIESGVAWPPYVVVIFIGASRVLVSIIMSYLSKKYGRRPPSIVSGAGMTICMGCLATYLYLKETRKISPETAQTLAWIPVVSLILYIITSTIGFLTLPWAMIGEVFPAEVRGLAAGLTTCMAYVFNFIIVKVYPDMSRALTEYGVFFFYGVFSVLGTIFVVLFLPETQGKTLIEIEEYFSSKKKKKYKLNGIEMAVK